MIEMMMLGGKKSTPVGNIAKFGTSGRGLGVLSVSGNLYTSGESYISGSGVDTKSFNLVAENVKDFWMGYRGLLAVTKDNRWLFMGQNLYFPTSIPSPVKTLTDVSQYLSYPEGLELKQVCFGFRALGFVFTSGQYALMGMNNSGGQGNGNRMAVRSLVLRTDMQDIEEIAIDPGTDDTVYLLRSSGQVVGAGDSIYGQLGVVGTAAVTTWMTIPSPSSTSAPCKKLAAGINALFRILEGENSYLVAANGRNFNGALGTGETSNSNYPSARVVYTGGGKSLGMLELYTGVYCARLRDPEKGMYFTGAVDGNTQGQGNSATRKYSFTALPSSMIWGPYDVSRANYYSSYVLLEGTLYGAGNASNYPELLPGVSGVAYLYTALDTSAAM